MVRDVDDAAGVEGLAEVREALRHAFHLAQDRVERVLQRAVDGVALRGAEFLEVALDPRERGRIAVWRLVEAPHVFTRQHRLPQVLANHDSRV